MSMKYVVRGQRVTKDKVALAKEMRSNMTAAEKILWQHLRANQMGGWHFRRQQILAGYIVDFYCHRAALIIELDGEIHKTQIETDRRRELSLTERGFHVIRFQNKDVIENLPVILAEINKHLQVVSYPT